MVSSTDDTQNAASAANAKAARKLFISFPSNCLVSAPSLGRYRAGVASRRRAALGLLLLDPERVMLLGPVEIDLAGAHRVERALHSDRADIDVRQHDGDEAHRDHGMNHGPDLQRRDIAWKVREQHEPAGHRHQRAADDHDPEDAFLAGIETPGRRMLAVGQDATALLDPQPIDLAWN